MRGTELKKKKKKKRRGAPAHFTREHQQHARSCVSSESCARNGAKGAHATIKRHGVDVLFKKWLEWKLASPPSRPEAVTIDVLNQLGIEFTRDERLGNSLYTVDFYLPATRQGIEVDGGIHKRLDVEKRNRQRTNKLKLLEEHGIPCLFIQDSELLGKDLSPVIEKIKKFITSAYLQEGG